MKLARIQFQYKCYECTSLDTILPAMSKVCLLRFLHRQHLYENLCSYLRLLKGELPSSMVGILCSPGRIHRMGPSLLLVGCMSFNTVFSLQGIV